MLGVTTQEFSDFKQRWLYIASGSFVSIVFLLFVAKSSGIELLAIETLSVFLGAITGTFFWAVLFSGLTKNQLCLLSQKNLIGYFFFGFILPSNIFFGVVLAAAIIAVSSLIIWGVFFQERKRKQAKP